jgi:hypothetical protein
MYIDILSFSSNGFCRLGGGGFDGPAGRIGGILDPAISVESAGSQRDARPTIRNRLYPAGTALITRPMAEFQSLCAAAATAHDAGWHVETDAK